MFLISEISPPKAYLDLCGKMIQVGEFLLAHDVAKEGLGKHKNDKMLAQKAAHALCKAGSPMMATQILEELVTSGTRMSKLKVFWPVLTRTFANTP